MLQYISALGILLALLGRDFSFEIQSSKLRLSSPTKRIPAVEFPPSPPHRARAESTKFYFPYHYFLVEVPLKDSAISRAPQAIYSRLFQFRDDIRNVVASPATKVAHTFSAYPANRLRGSVICMSYEVNKEAHCRGRPQTPCITSHMSQNPFHASVGERQKRIPAESKKCSSSMSIDCVVVSQNRLVFPQ